MSSNFAEIQGYLCVVGKRELKLGNCLTEMNKCGIWGFCPVCNELISCMPEKIINMEKNGTFLADVFQKSQWIPSPKKCIFYDHKFIVSYNLCDSIDEYDFSVLNCVFNLIIPHKSNVTELIINEAKLLKQYEKNVSNLMKYNVNMDYSYLKNILSWDNPWRCELVHIFEKITCKDISLVILRYIE